MAAALAQLDRQPAERNLISTYVVNGLAETYSQIAQIHKDEAQDCIDRAPVSMDDVEDTVTTPPSRSTFSGVSQPEPQLAAPSSSPQLQSVRQPVPQLVVPSSSPPVKAVKQAVPSSSPQAQSARPLGPQLTAPSSSPHAQPVRQPEV